MIILFIRFSEQFLKENQIEYKLGSKSKFANFLAKKLD